MTPEAQTSILPSTLKSFWFTKHYGAIYAKLPVSRSYCVKNAIAPAIPKSIIFIFFYSEFTSNMFSSFRSLWIKLFWWQYFIPRTICRKNICAVFSSSLPPSFYTYFKSSPPCKNSIIIATSIFFKVRQLWTFTIFSWFNDLRISASTKMLSISLTEPIF